MNAEQAKKLSLPRLLALLGHEPVREDKGGLELWYASPFRAEKTPSFHTSFLGGKWIWNDFADTGGTVIDFAMRYNGFRSVRETLAWLEKTMQAKKIPFRAAPRQPVEESTLFSFQQQGGAAAPKIPDSRSLEFLSAGPVSNPVILNYLTRERAIPESLVRRYLLEIAYRNTATGRDYFAFGMKNESGGYEIRVASSQYSFKSALIARDITLIPGTDPDGHAVSVFEGMTDFLSLLAMQGQDHLAGDALILHSLSSYPRAAEHLRGMACAAIHTFLDNDPPGQEGTAKFRAEFGDKVAPQNHLFAPYADINEALCARQLAG